MCIVATCVPFVVGSAFAQKKVKKEKELSETELKTAQAVAAKVLEQVGDWVAVRHFQAAGNVPTIQ